MRVRLLAALLVVVLGCFVALRVLAPAQQGAPERAVALDVQGTRARPASAEDAAASSKKTALEDSMHLMGSSARVVVPEPAPDRGFTMDVTRRMHLTIHFPEGTPDDEKCDVVLRASFAKPSDNGQISRAFLLQMNEVVRFQVSDGEEFDLPLPEGAEDVQVDVDARYVYFEHGGVTLTQEERLRPIELKPKLGGWVTLKLLAPPVYSAPPLGPGFAAAALEGVELRILEGALGPSNNLSASPRQHDATVGSEGTVELYAVTPKLPLHIPTSWILSKGDSDLSPFALPLGWTAKAKRGEHIEVSMQLTGSVRIEGVVLDEHEEPIPNAMIEVKTRANGFEWDITRAANASGLFDLRGIPGEPVHLRVQKGGYKTTFVSKSSFGTDMRVVLLDGPRIAGTVRLPDGTPVVGLRLRFTGSDPASFFSSPSVLTDARGHFDVSGTESTTYTIHGKARVDPLGSAKPLKSSSDNPAWQLEVPDVAPHYNHELELEMRVLHVTPEPEPNSKVW